MKRNQLFLFLFLCVFTVSAQAIPPTRIPRAVARAARSVSARSSQINRAAIARLRQFAQRTAVERKTNEAFLRNAHRFRPKVFEVKISTDGRHTASAFALNINGRVWGVTAAHVMENIHSDPYIQIRQGEHTILAPIRSWHASNKGGSDVAIFDIPEEVLPHVEVLTPAEKLPTPEVETQSPAFIRENYAFLPSEDVLFAGPHRILLRDQLRQEASGYCGSPVLANGEVIGLHVGVYSPSLIPSTWGNLFGEYTTIKTPLHVASPILHVLQLASEVDPATANYPSVVLKVLDRPVKVLTSQEQVYSVTLLREGHVKKEIFAHPFMHFDKLEEFFDLEENDVLRIDVKQPKLFSPRMETVFYDVNVSTGEITSFTR